LLRSLVKADENVTSAPLRRFLALVKTDRIVRDIPAESNLSRISEAINEDEET